MPLVNPVRAPFRREFLGTALLVVEKLEAEVNERRLRMEPQVLS
jgi:hypothetical protein